MNYISTWIYLDKKGEETDFPQSGMLSSTQAHQDLYWRCVYVFFKFAQKYLNNSCEYLLFTNFTGEHHIVDGIDVIQELKTMNVKIIVRNFTFKLPKGYYGAWGNQLYEFDILDEFSKNFKKDSKLLMLDSDCLITKNVSELFRMLDGSPAITFRDDDYKDCSDDVDINGITEKDMTDLSNEFLGKHVFDKVQYFCGEFFCARYDFIENIVNEFPDLYRFMILKFEKNPSTDTVKFNEEAHFLSFFYAKYKLTNGLGGGYVKRMWTADNYYRINSGDEQIPIWHVLSGKNRYSDIYRSVDSLLAKNQHYIVNKLMHVFLVQDRNYLERKNRIKWGLKRGLKKLGLFGFAKSLLKTNFNLKKD